MSCFASFLILLSLLIIAAGPMLCAAGRARRRRRAYRQIARRFHGRYQNGSLVRYPSVFLRHGHARAILREAAARGPYAGRCTQVQLDWPDRRLVCDIYPRAAAGRVKPDRRLLVLESG